jgi:endonuclease/exonuclease/phosphatase family metal-dependent hydrolase
MKHLMIIATLFVTLLVASTANASEPIRLRVLSYNIHHAEGVDGRLDVERIAGVIRSVEPDLVALQEVDRNVERSQSVDQPAELARLTMMRVVFGANIELQGGQYGNAILSRFPISRQQNHLLPRLDNGEQRGLLEAEIQLEPSGETLLLYATHLDHRRSDQERIASAKWINERVAQHPRQAALLVGDLNDVLGSRTLETLTSHWSPANEMPLPTIPVANPRRQIDFVLVRPREQWKVIDVTVLDEAVASDHRAILAILEFVPGETP